MAVRRIHPAVGRPLPLLGLILLAIALLSTVGIVGFVVPQFEKLFADMGDAVPLATRVVVR